MRLSCGWNIYYTTIRFVIISSSCLSNAVSTVVYCFCSVQTHWWVLFSVMSSMNQILNKEKKSFLVVKLAIFIPRIPKWSNLEKPMTNLLTHDDAPLFFSLDHILSSILIWKLQILVADLNRTSKLSCLGSIELTLVIRMGFSWQFF